MNERRDTLRCENTLQKVKLNRKALFYHSKTVIILFSIVLSFQCGIRGGDVRRDGHVVYFNYNDHANDNTINTINE